MFRAPFALSALLVASSICPAQEASATAPSQNNTPPPVTTNQEDIDSLKARLNDLEKRFKAQQEAEAAAKKSAAAAATAGGQDIIAEDQTKEAPFSDADWGWLNGNPRTVDFPLNTKYFTPEIRVDTNYNLDFNHPKDDTIGGSSEIFRSQEVQVTDVGLGGDFHLDNVHARFLSQFGLYSETTPRNDGSAARGQWDLDGAYRYVSEMNGGYHWDKLHGINVDAGIFLSYIGLFSFYQFDNWAYQPSFVSSNTPWFFNGVRAQIFPTAHLKIEPWFINGWQSYGRFNSKPGVGGQIKYARGRVNFISNNYGVGEDSLGNPNRSRVHTDNSFELKYLDRKDSFIDKMAFSLTGDLGCEVGAYVLAANSPTGNTIPGVACHKNTSHVINGTTYTNFKQSFVGWMAYNRIWANKDHEAITIGGGQINNPGRYLVLLPPINGATAISGSPYFTENPGDQFKGTDGTITYDYMPSQFITFRTEYSYRHSNVPYWSGRGGITPPGGTTSTPVGNPADYTCSNGTSSVDAGFGYSYGSGNTQASNLATAKAYCSNLGNGNSLWQPDLRKDQAIITFAILVKF
jgi:Putative beta-barrel porin-2, OmpL-like. bbp2